VTERRVWEQLAQELGFTFKEGLRAYLESDAVRRLEADGSDPQQAQALAQLRTLLDNPLLGGVVNRFCFGAVTGHYRGHECTLYHGAQSTNAHSSSESVHIGLLFSRPVRQGMLLAPETFFARVGRALFRTQDLATGNAELDRLVVVKAQEEAPVRVLLADRRVQAALLALFGDGGDWKITDEGIRWRRSGGTLAAAEALPLLERMAAVAEAMGR